MQRITLAHVQNSERFFRVPKQLFESPYYNKMSAESKLLYAILKDRFELSIKNNWVDKDGCIYMIYTVEDIREMLGCGRDKVFKLKKELKNFDLLEEVRQGLNKPNLIYIGALNPEYFSNPLLNTDVEISDFRKSEFQTSRSREIMIQGVGKSDINDTDISDTYLIDNNINYEEEEENYKNRYFSHNETNLHRKIEQVTQYDKDYIWNLVHDELLKERFSKSTADFAMIHFDQRYKYALENMRFARSAESIAEYVFNGIVSELNQEARRQQNM